jgi:hypothetical protein
MPATGNYIDTADDRLEQATPADRPCKEGELGNMTSHSCTPVPAHIAPGLLPVSVPLTRSPRHRHRHHAAPGLPPFHCWALPRG